MQINLVFSPFTRFCLPPGIALIKSYVEKNSKHHVKCFDLNCAYQNAFDYDIRNNKGHIKIVGHNPDLFLKSVDVIRTDADEFFEQRTFNDSANLFLSYFDKSGKLSVKAYQSALSENGPAPWPVTQCVKFLLSNKPDVVGFSIMFPDQFFFSALAGRMLKAADKNIRIVFGGISSTELYKEILTQSFADFVVMNEGEKAFLDLLNALDGDKSLDEVPNLAFRKDNEVIVNESLLVENLDELPFADFSDLDLSSYFIPVPVVSILNSRGCYWRRCAFCVHHKNYLYKYRQRSVGHTVDELEYHHRNGVRHFVFVDEMISSSRFKKIAEEIVRRKLSIYYYALGKPTSDFTSEVFDLMYESGCRYIIWGVESGCQRVLDMIDKGTKTEDMSRVLRDSASAGLKNHVFIMVGFPTETRDELYKTLEFLYENKDSIHAVHGGSFTLYKGSMIYENPEKYCITQIVGQGSCLDTLKYDVSEGMRSDELESYANFYQKNYFNHFASFSDFVVILRDHALLLYSNADRLVFNMERKPVPSPEETRAAFLKSPPSIV